MQLLLIESRSYHGYHARRFGAGLSDLAFARYIVELQPAAVGVLYDALCSEDFAALIEGIDDLFQFVLRVLVAGLSAHLIEYLIGIVPVVMMVMVVMMSAAALMAVVFMIVMVAFMLVIVIIVIVMVVMMMFMLVIVIIVIVMVVLMVLMLMFIIVVIVVVVVMLVLILIVVVIVMVVMMVLMLMFIIIVIVVMVVMLVVMFVLMLMRFELLVGLRSQLVEFSIQSLVGLHYLEHLGAGQLIPFRGHDLRRLIERPDILDLCVRFV